MSFAPANETAAQLWNERSIFVGLFLGSIGFGVHLTLFVQCAQALYARKEGHRNRELFVLICILFVLGNIGNATNILFGQKTFIDDRDYPGGPNAFFVEQSTNCWFQDALLVYWFWMIWSSSYYMVAVPVLAFLSSMVLSAILIAELSQPGNTFWTKISVNLAIPYWSISISMTIILTALIVGRLLFMRRRIRNLMGPCTSTPYVTVTAMLVESAAIYSINGLVFLISYGVNSPVQNLALPLLGQTQSIAPLLIILCVAQGQAWSSSTMSTVTSMRWRTPHAGPKNNTSATVLETLGANVKSESREDIEGNREREESELEFRGYTSSSVPLL
ncbi:hypothetical protein DFH07DRAFT_959171 [Mycena maculata]|uniref:Uncharacterized protein n=1 Tax=Mycena maculata TaxID=230809 RepID=A0AAD7NCH3_9AGAR|nr:hypothetical protein DFH07DRAFT_959171 [Mycena maculata]